MRWSTKLFSMMFLLMFFLSFETQSVNASTVENHQIEKQSHSDEYRVNALNYFLSNASKDGVYKQLTYRIIIEDNTNHDIINIEPKFDDEFDKYLYNVGTVFKKVKKSDLSNVTMVEVYVSFNSTNFDVKKLNEKVILNGLNIEENEEMVFVKIDNQIPAIKNP